MRHPQRFASTHDQTYKLNDHPRSTFSATDHHNLRQPATNRWHDIAWQKSLPELSQTISRVSTIVNVTVLIIRSINVTSKTNPLNSKQYYMKFY